MKKDALFDLVIRGGSIVDGSGSPRYVADIGIMVPGTYAHEDELLSIASAVGRVENRVMQHLGDTLDLDHDLPYTRELARRTQGSVHFIMSDTGWQRRLEFIKAGRRDGLKLYGHVAPRAVGMIGHWRAVRHPFSEAPSIQALAEYCWPEQLARLGEPTFKAQVLAETHARKDGFFADHPPERLFEITDYPDYEPDPETDGSGARRCRRAGVGGIRL